MKIEIDAKFEFGADLYFILIENNRHRFNFLGDNHAEYRHIWGIHPDKFTVKSVNVNSDGTLTYSANEQPYYNFQRRAEEANLFLNKKAAQAECNKRNEIIVETYRQLDRMRELTEEIEKEFINETH